MSTQQQIDQYNAAIQQKQQEKAGQETILRIQQEQLAKAETARIDAELAAQRAQNSGASAEQVAALQRQARLADQAESDARVAASQTSSNIEKLDGSIRFNTSNRDQFQSSLPAQGAQASTADDVAVNARANAAEIAPAPVPAANAPGAVENIGAGLGLQDPQQRAEIITPAAAPVPGAPGLLDPQQQAALAVQNTTAESVPLTDAESAALFEEAEANTIQNTTADPADDPYEAARQAAEEGEPPPTFEAEDLEDSPYEVARLAGEEEGDGPTLEAPEPVNDFVRDPVTGEQVPSDSDRAAEIRAEAAADDQVQVTAPAPVADSTQAEGNAGEAEASAPPAGAPGTLDPQQQAANEQAAAKANTINQATLNSVYKKEGSADWRVRLQLAPSSNYLYNQPEGQRGILDPLYYTNGVIFPYTPAINTSYKANYEQYDLVHSNYRGVYYKNSRVDDLQIRGIFTAQDTNEANYLLAVIHFFRSVTKMFYGKDEQRGSPPPLVFLSGFGMNQFYGHPCVVTSFAYNLPDSVDYIRATSVNNYGTDLLSRRTASSPSSAAGLGAVGNRLLNAGLANFTATPPAPSSVVASVNNIQLANYVPTKMDIDITLIPVQTRSQVSKQFSLKGFANGDLIKGGFW